MLNVVSQINVWVTIGEPPAYSSKYGRPLEHWLWYLFSGVISLRNSGNHCYLFLPFQPSSNPFQSGVSYSLGFFSLILQHIRPLIYSADVARKPKHPAKSVDSAIVRRTAEKPREYLLCFRGWVRTESHACVDCYQTDILDVWVVERPQKNSSYMTF